MANKKFIAERHILQNGEVVKPGDPIELDEKRAEKHLKAGWISETEQDEEVAPVNKPVTDMTKAELDAYAEENEVAEYPSSGTRDEKLKAIQESEQE